MIVRRGIDLTRLFLHLGPIVAALLAYDVVVTLLYKVAEWRWLGVQELPLPLLGSAIALIVSLRNNAAYARWWEARGLWGAVVNNARSFARGASLLLDDQALVAQLVRHQIAYAVALRAHLLRRPAWDELARYLPAETLAQARAAANPPFAVQMAMARQLAEARRQQGVDSIAAAALDRTLGELANAQGGLERIKSTPMPRQYDHLPLVFTCLYCLLLPIGLVGDLGYATPIGSTVVGVLILALDRIGRDLADPFEGTVHDLPVHAIARTIEIDLLQAIGVAEIPAAIGPVDGVLR